jgi:putative transposase
VSPRTGRRYPLALVCRQWRVARSAAYAARRRGRGESGSRAALGKRGPRTALSDEALVAEIRAVLAASSFHGEGRRQVRARLPARGIRVGKARVLRLMRLHRLLAPARRGHPHGGRAHSGTIIPAAPNELWGTDATRCYTRRDGWRWFFGAVDHHVGDVVGWHVAKVGDRWAAPEPVRQGVHQLCGGYAPKIALGLGLRMDWGP